MDNLIRDPDLAPKLFKLLNEKLQDTRKALELANQEVDALKSENAELSDTRRADRNSEEDASEQVQVLERTLEVSQIANQRLQTENAELRTAIEGYESREAENKSSEAGCSGQSCPAKQNVAQLENEVKRLREKLNVRIADFEDLQRSSEERRQQLAARDAEVRTLRDRLEELRKEFSARQIESEDKEARLRQDLDFYKEKFNSCRSQHPEPQTERRVASHTPTNPSVERGEGYRRRPSRSRSPQARRAERDRSPDAPAQKSMSWPDIVNYVLRTPCLPLNYPGGPHNLPNHIKRLMDDAIIISCPNRIVYHAFDAHQARVLAPVAHCKGPTATTDFGSPTNELADMVGCMCEVFLHESEGVCYAGSFMAERVSEVTQEEYKLLPLSMRDEIVRRTFRSAREYESTTRSRLDWLRNAYNTGRAKAQYLHLRYVGYNKPLFIALLDLGAMSGSENGSSSKRPPLTGFASLPNFKRPRLS